MAVFAIWFDVAGNEDFTGVVIVSLLIISVGIGVMTDWGISGKGALYGIAVGVGASGISIVTGLHSPEMGLADVLAPGPIGGPLVGAGLYASVFYLKAVNQRSWATQLYDAGAVETKGSVLRRVDDQQDDGEGGIEHKYYIAVRFEANDATVLITAEVAKEVYESTSVGAPIAVRYVPRDHRITMLAGEF